MQQPQSHTILLYYKYAHIEDAAQLHIDQRVLCESLGLKGRILVSPEGINGTVEGTSENTEKYIQAMLADPRFADVDFKKSEGNGEAFPKLSVKLRTEIVTLGTGTADLSKEFVKGKYIEPDELQKWYDNQKDFVVIDMRNDYEYNVGHFENSILLPVKNFKEIPEAIQKVKDELKNKKVVSVCTGGVRCEKATSYLMEQGFTDVHQLHGGMVRYLEQHPGKKFKGSLYVFDRRKVVNFDSPEQHTIVGKCLLCNAPSENYVNCGNKMCNIHFISCDNCSAQDVFCSDACRQEVAARNNSEVIV